MPNQTKILPVILCGGTGSRLWPLSRKSFPKQFLPINTSDNKSLLQNTYQRLIGLKNLSEPVLVCSEEHRFIVAEQMREINVKPKSIILEPFGKNTAPAVIFAALKCLEIENDPNLLILSSDHQINHASKFREVIEFGKKYVDQKKLVTFGIVPKSPETGYGYIKSEEPFDLKNLKGMGISQFIEKPNLENAKKFIKDSSFTWNSGIFLFKAQTIIDEMNDLNPQIFKICYETFKKSKIDLDFQRLDAKSLIDCPNISLDIAVMEKTKNGIVLPLDAEWSDIGSWKSVWNNSKKDKEGNALKGKVIIENSKNCYFRSEGRLIVGIDLNNLIIIETNDAILVSQKDSSQKIKTIVAQLIDRNFKEGRQSKKSYRPWGSFTNIENGPSWQVKKLEIKPKASISLQLHNKRSEHWVIVSGTAKIEIDNKVSFLKKNESAYIPLGAKHRLSNPDEIPLILIEVQSGSYLAEDDIVRFEDIYGRSTH